MQVRLLPPRAQPRARPRRRAGRPSHRTRHSRGAHARARLTRAAPPPPRGIATTAAPARLSRSRGDDPTHSCRTPISTQTLGYTLFRIPLLIKRSSIRSPSSGTLRNWLAPAAAEAADGDMHRTLIGRGRGGWRSQVCRKGRARSNDTNEMLSGVTAPVTLAGRAALNTFFCT